MGKVAMNQRRTDNPVVFRGPCKLCGKEVEVHDNDYFDGLSRHDLVHFACLEDLAAGQKEGNR